ncbi:DASH family cryptochrome [Liberiplasma polymorphum]|uniref:DASH family cryptochrome n=1 Tax=Liberiplasma polymorphum TaxID=3374570 RepID=UPI0037764DA1
MSNALVWFRNDLRIQDHKALSLAMKDNDKVIACYILDKTIYETPQYQFKRIGANRLTFLIEGLLDLKKHLEKLNVPFFILYDEPLQAFDRIMNVFLFDSIYYHMLVGAEEETLQKKVNNKFQDIKIHSYFEKTLIHPEDLPFKMVDLPNLFTSFKNAVEDKLIIRNIFPTPLPQSSIEIKEIIDFNSVADFGYKDIYKPKFKGGETEALKRLNYYLFESKAIDHYKETRNNMLFDDDSSKFSAYLAQGSLSARTIVKALKHYESLHHASESTYWLFYELLWRDFFIFVHMKYKLKIFNLKGIKNIDCTWEENQSFIDKFVQGKTGYPLIDANIKELHQTGFMSNRGRQNVASFFTKNLGLNWLIGAAFFEMMLIDYDVSINYGNWAYIAGVGNDVVPFRFFNVETQGERYDKDATYVKKYLPNLKQLPSHLIYKIHRLNQLDLAPYNIILGKDYPKRMVDFDASINQRKEIFNQNKKK